MNVQATTANKVNEITGVTNSVGTAWATPTYDGAGNMIGMPNPPVTTTGATPAWVPMTEAQWNTLTEAQWNTFTENTGTTPQQLSARYDAWNRLVLVTNGTQKVSENVYDARGYRIRKDTYTSGTLTEARHYYYTPGWQCVEERIGTTTTAERQFVWGLRYIDDLILRDRSTANNGSMNERRYAMQDGNWNTIAICDITGSVGERYAYSAYGSPVFMNGTGTVQTSSAIGFETLYAGYRFDGTTPQMYYVRNRFLLPMIGTWNKRDPLGYIDGMSLYQCYATLNTVDPFGTDDYALAISPMWAGTTSTTSPPKRYEVPLGWLDHYVVSHDMYHDSWSHPWVEYENTRAAGCVGVTRVLLGKMILFDSTTRCYYFPKDANRAYAAAQKWARRMTCPTGSNPGYFAYNFYSAGNDKTKTVGSVGRNLNVIEYCDACGKVYDPHFPAPEYEPTPKNLINPPITFDFCARQSCGRWIGANHSPPGMNIILWKDLADWVHFDFTYVKSADYAVFFAVLDSSSDLLLMGWGVQTQPVRLFDFLF